MTLSQFCRLSPTPNHHPEAEEAGEAGEAGDEVAGGAPGYPDSPARLISCLFSIFSIHPCRPCRGAGRGRWIDTERTNMVLLGAHGGAIMTDAMGTFGVAVQLENPRSPGKRPTLESVPVDTGAELSWIPAGALEALGVERGSRRRFRRADVDPWDRLRQAEDDLRTRLD